MFTLNQGDILRGAVTAVFTGILFVVGGAVMASGFDAFTADWTAIGKAAVNAGLASFVGYLMKNFFTDDDGRIFGKI